MQLFYNFAIHAYGFAIKIASPFSPKAKKWVEGRKHEPDATKTESLKGCIWIHCASLGEFEQGRPLIEKLRLEYSEKRILLTFFSPSGYEIRKNYAQVDAVAYLPIDLKQKVSTFLDRFEPSMAIFVKYEIWHNLYREVSNRKIPLYMISAIFREDQIYFKAWAKWFISTLKKVDLIFTQDEKSCELLRKHGLSNCLRAGDTRFDRVAKLAVESQSVERLKSFSEKGFTIVAGSTWPEDEELLINLLEKYPEMHLIIAPHEIHASHILKMKQLFKDAILWSNTAVEDSTSRVFIIDTIGLLGSAYRYGEIAYVGGGFGNGIHNTLEPAAYGLPVVFGPNYQKFNEAKELIAIDAAHSVTNAQNLMQIVGFYMGNRDKRMKAGARSLDYVERNKGATIFILDHLRPKLS